MTYVLVCIVSRLRNGVGAAAGRRRRVLFRGTSLGIGFNSAAPSQNGAVSSSDIVAGSDGLSGSGGDRGFQDGVAKGGQGIASLRELQELLKAARSDEPVKLIRTF